MLTHFRRSAKEIRDAHRPSRVRLELGICKIKKAAGKEQGRGGGRGSWKRDEGNRREDRDMEGGRGIGQLVGALSAKIVINHFSTKNIFRNI